MCQEVNGRTSLEIAPHLQAPWSGTLPSFTVPSYKNTVFGKFIRAPQPDFGRILGNNSQNLLLSFTNQCGKHICIMPILSTFINSSNISHPMTFSTGNQQALGRSTGKGKPTQRSSRSWIKGESSTRINRTSFAGDTPLKECSPPRKHINYATHPHRQTMTSFGTRFGSQEHGLKSPLSCGF